MLMSARYGAVDAAIQWGLQWRGNSMTDLPQPDAPPPPPNPGAEMPPPSGFSPDPKQAKAEAKAAKAHAKALRPWYKKKRFVLGGILALLVVLAIAAGDEDDGAVSNPSTDSGEEDSSQPSEEDPPATDSGVACKDAGPDDQVDTKRQGLFPDRADIQANDHEAALGDCVRLAGYTAFLDAAAVSAPQIGDPQLVIDVRALNRDDSAQPYNMFDWSLLTPAGTILSPTIFFGDGGLGSGDLVKGGQASGKVAFDVTDPGTYYVIFTPDLFNDDRGIWEIEI